MKILTQGNYRFTVKGGGHNPVAGSSSIVDGVTIDLVHLNNVTVSADRSMVSVGPGNRWGNVTDIIQPMGLAVVGGRDLNVGVSGLLIGGGISFFSGVYGWACDNVLGYEVLLASGNLVYASPEQNNDLYWALRGGAGLNFGIVTRFDLFAFEQGDIWANNLGFPGSSNATVVSTFQNLTINGMPKELGSTAYVGISYDTATSQYTTNVGLLNATVPSPPTSIPAVYEPFQRIPGATYNTTVAAPVTTFLKTTSTPYGGRWTWSNVVVKASFPPAFFAETMALFESRNNGLFRDAKEDSVQPGALVQPIPTNVLERMKRNGGNTFGLKAEDGALIMISFPTLWHNAKNDDLVYSATTKLVADLEDVARKHNVYTPFVYLNYAGVDQQVLKGYGRENYQRLKSIARKYDPEGKLTRLWQGYFKLGGRR
jgi:FAD/FMN-containing dehydrogenase